MQINNKKQIKKQEKFKKCVADCGSDSFVRLLTETDLTSIIEDSLPPNSKKRLYCPTQTLSMFLTQAISEDRSCQRAVDDFAIKKIAEGEPPVSTHTGAYTKARKRLLLPMIIELASQTGRLIERELPPPWLWKGKSVYLADGTTLTMPDTVANQEAYPQSCSQKKGAGFPVCRMMSIMSLASGAVINTAIAPYRGKSTGETSLLRGLVNTFKPGEAVVGDALLGTYVVLAAFIEQGVDVVFEQLASRKSDFRSGLKLGPRDHKIVLKKSKNLPLGMTKEEYDLVADTVTIREIKIGHKRYITTFLSPKEVSKKDIKMLYKDRWHVELDLRNIKTTMGMDELSCKTPEMIEKEVWIYMLAYNLIRLLMAQSALLADTLPRKLSFKHTVQLWLAWCIKDKLMEDASINSLFILIAQKRVGNRPGRIEPRMIKRRPKSFWKLNTTRDVAREHVKKYGHPKM